MFESCQEAHRHWLASKEAEAKIDYFVNPKFEFNRRTADAERNSARTSWQAHLQGVCSCVANAIVERQRREKLQEPI